MSCSLCSGLRIAQADQRPVRREAIHSPYIVLVATTYIRSGHSPTTHEGLLAVSGLARLNGSWRNIFCRFCPTVRDPGRQARLLRCYPASLSTFVTPASEDVGCSRSTSQSPGPENHLRSLARTWNGAEAGGEAREAVGYPTCKTDQMPGRPDPLITAGVWERILLEGRHLTCNFQCDPPKMTTWGFLQLDGPHSPRYPSDSLFRSPSRCSAITDAQ